MSALKRKSIGTVLIVDPKKICSEVPVAMHVCGMTYDILILIFRYIRSPFLVSSVRVVSKAWKRAADYWIEKWFVPWLCQLYREAHTELPHHTTTTNTTINELQWVAQPQPEIQHLPPSADNDYLFDVSLAHLFSWNNEAYIFSRFLEALGPANVFSDDAIDVWCYEVCMWHDRPEVLRYLQKRGFVHVDRVVDSRWGKHNSFIKYAQACIEKQYLCTLRVLLVDGVWRPDAKHKSILLDCALEQIKKSQRWPTIRARAKLCARFIAELICGKKKNWSYLAIVEKKDKCLLKAWEFLFANPTLPTDASIEAGIVRASISIPRKDSIHLGMNFRGREIDQLKLLPASQETLKYDAKRDTFVPFL